ncbi:hypothetical protein PMIN03_009824 [Paraphaeosphaeria minitans]|uniref:Peptidase S8/S53 domain-containing protein n=1 Tax=Paraphaeosphaeria minitans TaxID=565426 RepID=A0A9P6KV83_9PLEO|nr:hypothetical protein PMIN01_02233 [Paraphaeosphaeria minitans]
MKFLPLLLLAGLVAARGRSGKPTKSVPTSSISSSSSSTPPSATAPTKLYVVYPKKSTSKTDTTAINKLLQKYVKTPKDLVESGVSGIIINYWRVPLNAASAETLARDPRIASITADTTVCIKDSEGKCFNPATSVSVQDNAEDGLVYLAQREGTALSQYGKEYHYEEEAGRGVTCYILDDGFDLDSPEFKDLNVRWLPAGTTNKKSDLHHGTCMLSKMAGKVHGVAKNCNVVLVKVTSVEGTQQPGAKPAADSKQKGRARWLDGLSLIVEDVHKKKPEKAVISLSLYWPLAEIQVDVVQETRSSSSGPSNSKSPKGRPGSSSGSQNPPVKKQADEDWIQAFYENLKLLDEAGVVLVAGAGNDFIGNMPNAAQNKMDGYPASFGSASAGARELRNMIVVGATNPTTGQMYQKNNFDDAKHLPHIFAPGEDVYCIRDNPNVASIGSGTSQATASTAGLAAYLMSLSGGPRTPSDVKNKILADAWVVNQPHTQGLNQPKGGLKRVWNGVDVDLDSVHCPKGMCCGLHCNGQK